MSDHMDEIRKRHKDAIERFGKHYEPRRKFGLPHLVIGVQSFALNYDPDDPRHDDEHREWLGIMVAVALKNLVDEHTKALRAENERLREEVEYLKNPPKRYCAKCGHPEDNHPYRHPFVALETKKGPGDKAQE